MARRLLRRLRTSWLMLAAFVARGAGIAMPSPALTPIQVVEAQLSALQRGDIKGCFAFASPSNRAATGPWQRFEVLVRQTPAYAPLVGSTRWAVVGALPTGERSFRCRVRVWPAGSSSAPFAVAVPVLDYDWMLSKQGAGTSYPDSVGDVADCWMTDAVMPDASPRDAWDSMQTAESETQSSPEQEEEPDA